MGLQFSCQKERKTFHFQSARDIFSLHNFVSSFSPHISMYHVVLNNFFLILILILAITQFYLNKNSNYLNVKASLIYKKIIFKISDKKVNVLPALFVFCSKILYSFFFLKFALFTLKYQHVILQMTVHPAS